MQFVVIKWRGWSVLFLSRPMEVVALVCFAGGRAAEWGATATHIVYPELTVIVHVN